MFLCNDCCHGIYKSSGFGKSVIQLSEHTCPFGPGPGPPTNMPEGLTIGGKWAMPFVRIIMALNTIR